MISLTVFSGPVATPGLFFAVVGLVAGDASIRKVDPTRLTIRGAFDPRCEIVAVATIDDPLRKVVLRI